MQVAAARAAAWEHAVKEAQRKAELEQQAARQQAREAHSTAEQDKKAMQDAFKKKGRYMPYSRKVPVAFMSMVMSWVTRRDLGPV